MAYTNQAQQNFASGELSPKVRGRFELKIFKNGVERMQNFIAETQGPARFRTGTRFVNHTRLNRKAFLIEFQFNDEQSYVLEFTDLILRFYRNSANILEAAVNITGAGTSQTNPVVVTSAGHPFLDGEEVFLSGIVGMTELNNRFFIVSGAGANTFNLTDVDGNNIDGTGFTAYASGGTIEKIHEIATPYLEADLFQLKVAQNADTMYIVHPTYEPRKLTRTGHAAWTLATFVRTADPFTVAGKFPRAVAFYEARICYGGTNDSPETFWMSRAPTNAGATRYDDFTTGADYIYYGSGSGESRFN